MPRDRSAAVKVPPYSVHAEKIVLGSLLADATLLESIAVLIPTSDAFFRPEHARLYAAIVRGDDIASFQTDEKTAAIVSELQSHAHTQERAIAQARTVANKWHMRTFIDAASDMLNDAYHADGDVAPVLHRARERLDAFAATLRQSGDE